ncbi:MAG TPA: Maf family protein [Thermoanaerobaculia bacterium]|nr:Maf family protein [Thermoanaerobaculia bacterium]
MTLILASASPRRRELLQTIGFHFEVQASEVEEVRGDNEAPERYVARLSEEKAAAVGQLRKGSWIVAADTTVVIDDQVLEKPQSRDDAVKMLTIIRGRTHLVHTGVRLQSPSGTGETTTTTSRVTMSSISDSEIEWYVSSGEPMDKAGSYAIQGIGAIFVELVEGSYTNVVGLPLETLMKMMRRAGLDPTALVARHR